MTIIEEARHFLSKSQPEEALDIMTAKLLENQQNIQFLQLYGEVLLENNAVEEAYNIFVKTCELDPTGEKGVEKFLYLGQIIGGPEGIQYLDIGLNQLNQSPQKDEKIIKKLLEGIFAQIEIWMTDLCMEPEAEGKCNELIQYALKLDDTNPESYSLLSSIRISQQLNEEAKEALKKSWDLFKLKKERLQTELTDDELNFEFIELIQPLMTICKFAIELELYDASIEMCQTIQEINDQILEVYYYETISHLFKAKQEKGNDQSDYRELPNTEVDTETVQEVKSILTNAFKVMQTSEGLDQEIVGSINDLLSEFGGPVMSELMPVRIDENDDNWENEIEDN